MTRLRILPVAGLPAAVLRARLDGMTTSPHVPVLGDRALFPQLEPRAYLNHAAISPPSLAVIAAVQALLADYARHGVAAFLAWHTQRERLRGLLARLIGAGPEDIGLVPGTTPGLLAVAQCLPWRPQDRIIVFQGEFPSNVTPWQQAAARFDLGFAMLPAADPRGDEDAFLSRLEVELRGGRVRLVAVSAVQFQTGWLNPLGEMAALCHRHGAEICVDAVQAVGIVPLDVRALGIDYMACGSHKWLMGMEGAGFLYVAPERIAALRPMVAGWASHEDGLSFLFQGPGHLRYDRAIRKRTDFVESGNLNAMGYAALEASVGLIADLGVPCIHAHVQICLDRLEEALVERGFQSLRSRKPERRSGILSVRPPPGRDVVAMHQGLTAGGVSCSIPDGWLRFSPHWPNRPEEVDAVLDAVDALGHGA